MPCEMSLVKHIGKQEVAACKCYKNFLDTDNFHLKLRPTIKFLSKKKYE